MVDRIPVIDVSSLYDGGAGVTQSVARELDDACREVGFFLVTGHRIDTALLRELRAMSALFFALNTSEKEKIAMAKGGKAWRGWFPLGGELTSGKADGKEGLYFGTEGDVDDERALHGVNQFPQAPAVLQLREAVLMYMQRATELARVLMRGIAVALGLAANTFEENITYDPTVLFRSALLSL
jgi:isopenicillin N synthase-like dioxygenase